MLQLAKHKLVASPCWAFMDKINMRLSCTECKTCCVVPCCFWTSIAIVWLGGVATGHHSLAPSSPMKLGLLLCLYLQLFITLRMGVVGNDTWPVCCSYWCKLAYMLCIFKVMAGIVVLFICFQLWQCLASAVQSASHSRLTQRGLEDNICSKM